MPGIKAADAYAVIAQVGRNWKRFAREKLELSENEVEDCEYMDRDNLTEQRFQMIQTWIRKNGRHATISRLAELAGWDNPTEQRHREPSQAASQNYVESPSQSNFGANRSVKVLRTPVSDIPNPMDAWKKAQANVNDVENRSNLPVEATSNLMLSEGANTKVQSVIALTDTDDANKKAFGDVNSAVKPNHKRSESESTVISSSSASSECYDSSLSLKRNGKKKGRLGKLKRVVSSIRKGMKTNSKNAKTFSTGQDSKENVCSRVGKVKVDLVSEEDIQRITSIKNRYCTEKYPGCALILNNSFKNNDHFRDGADEDVNNMEQLWKQMGCEIYGGEAQQEKSANQMRTILKQIPLLEQKYSYIVVVIMSHGGLDGETTVIRGVDGRNISVTEIETIFNNRNAPRLKNIPKLFFFQFCCGGDFDYGVDVDHARFEKSFKRMPSVNEQARLDVVQIDGHKIPTSSDMHFAFATHKYRPAIRSRDDGSWFISAVTNVFMHYARSESVPSMLLRVKEAMMEFSGDYLDEVDGKWKELKSLSWDGGSLIRQLYLLPGYSIS